jgi:hypothetical protein
MAKKATSILAAQSMTSAIGLDKIGVELQFIDQKNGTNFFIKCRVQETKQRYLKRLIAFLRSKKIVFKLHNNKIRLTTNNIIKLTV